MFITDSLIAWVFSIMFVGGILFGHTLRYEPVWVTRDMSLRQRWDNINLTALFMALAASAGVAIMYSGMGIEFMTLSAVTTGTITFCAVQSFESDYATRQADRYLLNYSILAVGTLSIAYHSLLGADVMVGITLFLMLISCALFFVPGFGQSDTRALLLVFAGVPAIIGTIGVQHAIIGFLVLTVVYLLIAAVQQRQISAIFNKTSIPAVPLILMPAGYLLLAAPVLY